MKDQNLFSGKSKKNVTDLLSTELAQRLVKGECNFIATDKRGIHIIFFLFLHENICCGTHQKRLGEALLMNTHNICFCGEIRKISAFFR